MFFKLINSPVPRMFPELRFGFIETGASWLPWVLYTAGRRAYSPTLGKATANLMEEYRLYVTCQVGEDVPYIVQHAGENTLMIGTDYGHQDSSTELEALRTLGEKADISRQLHKKIVDDNPRRSYCHRAAGFGVRCVSYERPSTESTRWHRGQGYRGLVGPRVRRELLARHIRLRSGTPSFNADVFWKRRSRRMCSACGWTRTRLADT